MTFNLHDFVMKTLKGMSEREDEYHVREYALKWYIKGVLTDEDMEVIEGWFTPAEEPADDMTDGEADVDNK